MTALAELSEAARAAVAGAGRATVAIGRGRRGSGLVVAEGRVLTNAHNLRDGTTLVTFADGREVQGEVVAADPDGDLAVLSTDTGDTEPVTWAAALPRQGDWVIALSAAGLRGVRVTVGTVSATDRPFQGPRGRRIAGSLEHTAPLPRGSSGGPLLDLGGSLAGVNTHRVESGFYLALPADEDLARRVRDLGEGTAPPRRRLGVAVAPRHVAARLRAAVGLPPRDGLLVRAVEEGSPAERAGIQRGDLLVSAGDHELGEPEDLFDALEGTPAGADLVLGVVRGVDESTVVVPGESGGAPQGEG